MGAAWESNMLSIEARARLAAQQAELVRALAGQATAPVGFDADRVRAASAALAAKRRSSVARAWPALPSALGERFRERFDEYAEITPLPRHGGPLADGLAFLRWLATIGDDPEECKLSSLAVALRYKTTTDGLVPRRGPTLKIAMLTVPRRRLVIALRLPWLGEWWLPLNIGLKR
jgi:hypothetical protein